MKFINIACLFLVFSFLPGRMIEGFAGELSGSFSGMHTDAQIQFVRSQLDKKAEPYWTAFQKLIERADQAFTNIGRPPEDFYVPGRYVDPEAHAVQFLILQQDGAKAYRCALAYRLTGDKRYEQKACELLTYWATKNKKYSGHDGALALADAGSALVIAAQLMSESELWKSMGDPVFRQWLINVYRKASNEIRSRPNNWGDWGRFGSMLSAIYLEDQAELDKNVVLLKSDLFTKIATDGSLPEETKREENGLWYTYFSLAPITATCWLIYNNTGENLFTWEKNGVSLKSAIDYLYYYNLHPDEYPWHGNPITGSPNLWPGNLFEAMYGIYGDGKYLTYVKPKRPVMYDTHHFAWIYPTLTPFFLNGY